MSRDEVVETMIKDIQELNGNGVLKFDKREHSIRRGGKQEQNTLHLDIVDLTSGETTGFVMLVLDRRIAQLSEVPNETI